MDQTANDIYDSCFKAKIAIEAAPKSNVTEIANDYAIPEYKIHQWVQQLENSAEQLFEDDGTSFSNEPAKNRNHTALLCSTLEASPNGILATDLNRNVITYNQRCVEMWKLPQHIAEQEKMEATVLYILQLVKHPRKMKDTIEEIYTYPDDSISQMIELKDGRFYKWHSVPYRSGDTLLGRVATFEDITEYKKTEEKLGRFGNLLDSITTNINEGILRSTPDDGLIYVNDAFVDIFGYDSQEEILATDPAQFYADKEEREKLVQKLKQEKQFNNEEVLYRRKDGSTFWGLENSTLIESNGQIYIDGVVTNIDNWKKAQQALLKSEEKYRTILKNIEEGYFETNLDGDFTFFNSALVDMMRYPAEQMMGMNNGAYMEAEDAKRVYDIFNKIYCTGQPENAFDLNLICGDGSRIIVETSIILRKNPDGEPVGFRGVVRDVTERKRKEEQIRSSLKEKEVLLGEIHHRVKNNLAVISGLLYLQAEKSGDDITRQELMQSQNRINSMALIHELLYHNKSFSSLNPDVYIKQLVEHISSNLTTGESSVSTVIKVEDFNLEMTTAIPCALIINELITNAYKYAFKGKKEGVITILFKKKEGGAYYLKVSDDGVGLSGDFQISDSSHHSLGLSLVKTLTRQLKGELSLTDDVGTGFVITFPSEH